MAELALGAIGPAIEVVKFVSKQIIRQFNYLCCFTNNINSLKDEAKKLNDALEELEGEVEIARDNLQEPLPAVTTWLRNSNQIKEELTGILSEATNVESGCLKLGARFSLSKRAKQTTDRTIELRGENKFDVKFQQGPPVARQALQFGKTFDCESRNKIEEDIMTTLRGGGVNMIGICGMGGLGKTTMAKKIRNKVLDEKVFQEVVMAVVSQPVEKSKIQVEIGGSLGLDLNGYSSETRVQKLYARLSSTTRSTLLILDDVWERLVLEDFGIPRDSKGCTILLTSRDGGVLHEMGAQIFGMKVLSDEEAWSFFRERVGTCVDDRKLNPIAEEVAKECGGLPLALEIVSAVLKDEDDVSLWEDALRQLSHSDPDIPEFITKVYNPLKLSYDGLRSQQAKSMFLLFCLFREDDDIPLEYLTYFCMGLRIFKGVGNLMEARNKTHALTKMLKSRSLLLESNKEDCVRMHDVVRDVCIFIAKEDGYIGREGCTWISSSQLVGERNELLSGSRCPDLRLLFLDSKYVDYSLRFEFDDAFVEGMRELYVLHFKNYFPLTRLPRPAQSLGKLNTLILHSIHALRTISVVGELVNLEILICRNCYSIEELPSEMKGLHHLKVLELTRCGKLQRIERDIISSLVHLEELKMHESFKKWEGEDREERENAGLIELEKLTNLRCLEIDIEDPSLVSVNMPDLSKNIGRFIIRNFNRDISYQFNKTMSLWLERETHLGDWIERLLGDIEYLELKGDGENNVDLQLKSQNIRWLELNGCGKSMKNVVRTSGGDDATVFPLIEHLGLYYLPELQEICDGPISSTSFHNLKELDLKSLGALTKFWKSSSSVCENINYVPHFTNLSAIFIFNCNSLRNLGQLSMAGKGCLPHLQQLHIESCKMMEQVFLWNDNEAGENKNSSIESQQKLHVIFPKLKEVRLNELPNLTKVIEDEQQQERTHLVIPKLENLHLQSLPKLVSFCHWKCEVELPLLRKVYIYDCPNMESFNMGFVAAPNVEAFNTDLKTYVGVGIDVAFDNLKELKIGYNEVQWNDDKISVSLVNGLEKLEFLIYKGSMSLLSSSAISNLVNLRALVIKYCYELVKVIEDKEEDVKVMSGGEIRSTAVFPKLEEIHLVDLPKLVRFCEWKCDVKFPTLREVKIDFCPNMESFGMGSVAAPNLKIVQIDKKEIDATKDLNGALHQHYLARPGKEISKEEEEEEERRRRRRRRN